MPLRSLAHSLWVNGFIRGGSVSSRTPWGSMILSGGLGFTQEGPGCRLVHPGYIVRILGSSGFFSVRSRTPRWVHPVASAVGSSLVSLAHALGVVPLIRRWVHATSLVSLGVVGFTDAHPEFGWVHVLPGCQVRSRAPWWSRAPWGSLGSLGSEVVGFARARPRGRGH